MARHHSAPRPRPGAGRVLLGVFLLSFAIAVAALYPAAPEAQHHLRTRVDQTPYEVVSLGAYWGAASDVTTAGRYW